MIRSYYRSCCINERVIFSHCVHLKLGHRFHALLKVCSDRDDAVPLMAEVDMSQVHVCIRELGELSKIDLNCQFSAVLQIMQDLCENYSVDYKITFLSASSVALVTRYMYMSVNDGDVHVHVHVPVLGKVYT